MTAIAQQEQEKSKNKKVEVKDEKALSRDALGPMIDFK